MSLPTGRLILALILSSAISHPVLAVQPRHAMIPLKASAGETTVDTIVQQLQRGITIERPFEAPLKDLLAVLHDRAGVNLYVNRNAFRNAEPPLEDVEGCKIKLPALKNTRVATVLNLALDQLDGTFLVRRDHVEITTIRDALALHGEPWVESDPDDDDAEIITQPLSKWRPIFVHLTFTSRSLHDIVHDLNDANPECNILIAPAASEKAKTLLTGHLVNLPAHKALNLLADMADLKVVVVKSAHLIATRESAEPLLNRLAEEEIVERVRQQLSAKFIFMTPRQIREAIFPPKGNPTTRRPTGTRIDDYVRRIRDRQGESFDPE